MNISNFFDPTPITKNPSYISLEIKLSMKNPFY